MSVAGAVRLKPNLRGRRKKDTRGGGIGCRALRHSARRFLLPDCRSWREHRPVYGPSLVILWFALSRHSGWRREPRQTARSKPPGRSPRSLRAASPPLPTSQLGGKKCKLRAALRLHSGLRVSPAVFAGHDVDSAVCSGFVASGWQLSDQGMDALRPFWIPKGSTSPRTGDRAKNDVRLRHSDI